MAKFALCQQPFSFDVMIFPGVAMNGADVKPLGSQNSETKRTRRLKDSPINKKVIQSNGKCGYPWRSTLNLYHHVYTIYGLDWVIEAISFLETSNQSVQHHLFHHKILIFRRIMTRNDQPSPERSATKIWAFFSNALLVGDSGASDEDP